MLRGSVAVILSLFAESAPFLIGHTPHTAQQSWEPRVCERDIYYQVGRMPKKIVNKAEKLQEANATTLRTVRLARSCAHISFIGIRTLSHSVTRGYGEHSYAL